MIQKFVVRITMDDKILIEQAQLHGTTVDTLLSAVVSNALKQLGNNNVSVQVIERKSLEN